MRIFGYGKLELELDRDELSHEELEAQACRAWADRGQYDGNTGVGSRGICSACEKVYGFEVESWDEVFGRPLKKGGRLNAERRNLAIKYRVHRRVRELNEAGRGLGKNLFDEVGKEFGINGTLVSELYYEAEEGAIFPPPEDR
jgi:hypothetical protein